jgi:hypothetical protein
MGIDPGIGREEIAADPGRDIHYSLNCSKRVIASLALSFSPNSL